MTSTTGRISVSIKARRSGFTLWEMLLVLAILGSVTAISWPVFQKALDSQRLKQASQAIWMEATATRMRAIEASAVYQFRYEVGGRRWASVPWEVDPNAGVLADEGSLLMADGWTKNVGELPEGLVFAALPEVWGGVEQLSRDLFTGLPRSDEWAGVMWAPPIVFFPDGSSYDNGLRIADAQGKFVTLLVRGITGGVTVGRVEQEARQ